MILMYVSSATAYVTKSLYSGLIQVVTWKILYSILGVLLLKLAMNPQYTGMEDYLMSIIVNLCIGVSMLFIPFATKSLLNDGLQAAATALAAVPTMAAGVAIKSAALQAAKSVGSKGLAGAKFLGIPAKNWTESKLDKMRARLTPTMVRAEKLKEKWKDLGLETRTDYTGRKFKVRSENRDEK